MAHSATNVPAYGGFVSDAETHSVVVRVQDPGADTVVPAFRFPVKGRIRAAYAIADATLAAGTVDYYAVNLFNGSTAGTAQTVISGTVGGTAGWVAATPKTITVNTPGFAAGEWVSINYDETGTGIVGAFAVQLDIDLYPTS